MEQTLGKRIAACRKGLGLTQEALADQLGVTAQAVSKWENDLSCPDITMLPKLSEVFGVTTDELLGIRREPVHTAEVVTEEKEEEEELEGPGCSVSMDLGKFEFQYDMGRRGKFGLGLWVILTATIILAVRYLAPGQEISLWDALWPSGVLVYGLMGLYPKFSLGRQVCVLFVFGSFGIYKMIDVIPYRPSKMELLAAFLLLVGLCLLVEAFRKPGKGKLSIHKGHGFSDSNNYFTQEGEGFDCALAFGENHYLVTLPRLSRGKAQSSFGELTLDLSGCEEIADGCRLEVDASFGELRLLVPRKYRVEQRTKTAFAAMEMNGEPDKEARSTIYLDGKASFGHLEVRYI